MLAAAADEDEAEGHEEVEEGGGVDLEVGDCFKLVVFA